MQSEVLEGFRLSTQQERLWLLQRQGAAYVCLSAILIEGDLDIDLLNESLQRVVDRHDILRTGFHRLSGMELPLQVIEENGVQPWRVIDLRHLDQAAQRERIDSLFEEERWRPRPLTGTSVLSVSLALLSKDRRLLLLGLPALCGDTATIENLFREIGLYYSDCLERSELSQKPLQYFHFSEWQKELVDSDRYKKGKEYWRERLLPRMTDLESTFGKRTGYHDEFNPAYYVRKLEDDRIGRILEVARRYDSPVSSVLHTCWLIFLSTLTGEADILTGYVSSGRKYEELKRSLGPYSKTLAIPLHIGKDDSFLTVLKKSEEAVEEAVNWHDEFSWERKEEFDDELDGVSFFPCVFEFRERLEKTDFGSISISIHKQYDCVDRFKLKLCCVLSNNGLDLEFHYDGERLSRDVIESFADNFEKLLSGAIEKPEARAQSINMLAARNKRRLLVEFNKTSASYNDEKCIHEVFEEQAGRFPDHIALIHGERQLTYAQLNRSANRLAHYLRECGVGLESVVGVCLERSPEMVICILGALKAGGAYLPLDSNFPQERLSFMLEDADVGILLTRSDLTRKLPANGARVVCIDTDWDLTAFGDCGAPGIATTPSNLAYVIYTSGTTGQPKGVMIEHKGVVNLGDWQAANFNLTSQSRISQFFSYNFDGAVGETYMALLNGATLVISDLDGLESERVIEFLNRNKINVAVFVPSLLALLDPRKLESEGSLTVVSVGEACPAKLASEWASFCNFINGYGPTEYTVYSHVWRVPPELQLDRKTPIGFPIHNTRTFILNDDSEPIPIGVAGEIYISGAGIARGYLNDPIATATKFLPGKFCAEGELWDDELLVVESARAEIEDFKASGVVREQAEQGKSFTSKAGISPVQITEMSRRLPSDLAEKTFSFIEDYGTEKVIYEGFCRYFIEAANGIYSSCGINAKVLKLLLGHEDFRGLQGTDFCFGNGEIMQTLRRLGAHMTGIDLSPFFVQKARDKKLDARLGRADLDPELFIKEHAIESGSQDFALATLALDRVADPANLLENIFSVLKAGGRFAIQTLLPIVPVDDGDVDNPITYTPTGNHITTGLGVEEDKAELIKLLRRLGAYEINTCRLPYVVASRDGIQEYRIWSFFGSKAPKKASNAVSYNRVYKTGDLGRFLPDGSVEFLGRVDNQVKIRGFRIEMEEIDVILRQRPDIKESVTVALEDDLGEKRLVTYLVGRWGIAPSSDDLRKFLGARLPNYMMPSTFVTLERLPRSPIGKVDRRALPSPEMNGSRSIAKTGATFTPVEEILIGIWSGILRVERIGVNDNFFDLGGHSLLATQLISRIWEKLNVELPLRILFETPTVAGQARQIEAALNLNQTRLNKPLVPAPRGEYMPVSFSQQRLWFFDQMYPASHVYNISNSIWISGELDILGLRRTLTRVTSRHEALRTSFPSIDGQPYQKIAPAEPFHLPVIDLSMIPGQAGSESRRLAGEEASRGFDLTKGPLLRVTVVKVTDQEHAVLFTMHHIISDGWSMGVLVREVERLYEGYREGREVELEELEIQYADYAAWQREWMSGEVEREQIEYWKEQLKGAEEVLNLPTDRERGARQSYRGGKQTFMVDEEVTLRLKELSRREGATLFMVLLSAFKALLYRYSGQEDIIVGADIANRTRKETEPLIGFFANQIALRTDLSGNPSFRELLSRVKEVSLGAYAHQDAPFDKIVETLNIKRDIRYSPLFQVIFSLQNAPIQPLKLAGVTRNRGGAEGFGTSKYDLLLNMWESGDVLMARFGYNTDLFEHSSIAQMVGNYLALVEGLSDNLDTPISELPMMSEDEYEAMLESLDVAR